MKLGISTYSFPWSIGVPGYETKDPMTAMELLNYAISNGITHVQFGDNMPLHKFSANELKQIKEFALAHKLTLEVGMRGLIKENVLEYISLASRLGSPFLRIVIDDAEFRPEQEEIISTIRDLLPNLRDNGVRLAIENHDRFRSVMLEQIIKELDYDWIGICLDTANSFGALEGTYETIDILAPYTLNLHIKDIVVNRVSHKMGFTISGTAAGSGMLDIPGIINIVDKYGRCNSITLEVWSDFDQSIGNTIQKEKDLVSASLQYLKQFVHE